MALPNPTAAGQKTVEGGLDYTSVETSVGSGLFAWILDTATEIEEESTARVTGSDFPDNRKQIVNAKQIYVKNASGKSDFNRERNLGVYDVANYADHYDDFGANGTSALLAERNSNADAVNAALADARSQGGPAKIVLPRSFDMTGELLINRPHWHVCGSSDVEVVVWGGSVKIDGDSYGTATGDPFMRGCKVSNLNIRRRAGGPGPAIEVLNNGSDVGPIFHSPILLSLEDLRVLSVEAGSDGVHWKGGFQGQMVRCYIGTDGGAMETGLVVDTISGLPGGVAANALEIIGGEVKACRTGFIVKNSVKVGFTGNFVAQGNHERAGIIGEGNLSAYIDQCYFEKNGTNPAGAATDQNCVLVIGDDDALTASTSRGTTITNSVFFGGPLDHAIVVNKANGIYLRDNFFGAGIYSVFNKRPTFTTGKMSGGARADTTTPSNHIKNDFGNSSLTYMREAQPYTLNLSAAEKTISYADENQILRSIVANTEHPVTIAADATDSLPVGFEFKLWNQEPGATITITPAAGVQLRQPGGVIGAYTHDALYGTITLRKVGGNLWTLFDKERNSYRPGVHRHTVTVADTTANPFTATLPATAFNSEADISVIDNANLGVLDAPEHYSIAGATITFVNTVRDQLVAGDKIKIIYSEQV